MTCPRCKVDMEQTAIDDEVKVYYTGILRIKSECPSCHLRLFHNVKGAEKDGINTATC